MIYHAPVIKIERIFDHEIYLLSMFHHTGSYIKVGVATDSSPHLPALIFTSLRSTQLMLFFMMKVLYGQYGYCMGDGDSRTLNRRSVVVKPFQ